MDLSWLTGNLATYFYGVNINQLEDLGKEVGRLYHQCFGKGSRRAKMSTVTACRKAVRYS